MANMSLKRNPEISSACLEKMPSYLVLVLKTGIFHRCMDILTVYCPKIDFVKKIFIKNVNICNAVRKNTFDSLVPNNNDK